jgi:hypothetical protein
MIMRRLAQSLKDQNWMAIAIEFVLLVLGVFLGIQVANWNAELIERREARDSMLRLQEDLGLSIQLTQSSIDFMADNARLADLALARLRACDLPARDRDDFATSLYRLGKVTPARFVRTTFDELRDSGKLRLIGNPGLRRDLTEVARLGEWYDKVFTLIAGRLEAHEAYIDGQVIFDVDGSIGGGGRIGWERLDMDFEVACRDRRFLAAVAASRNYTYDVLSDAAGMQARFEALLAKIEKENAR